ncbi:MAG: hypothetical protein EOO54_19905 [Haliea sp.]|nr:MAG: hypothetical protein EOO54_19905 [Haliea sp.]
MLSLSLGAAFGAHAQSTSPTGPGNTNSQKAGEAYPNDPNAANPNKPKAEIVQKAENSRPVAATKRVAKKTTNAVKKAGTKTADAVRNTGDKINEKVAPGPNDPKK